jgi:hypothetical protein
MPFRRHAGASYPKPSSLHALLVIEFFHALLVVEGREAAGSSVLLFKRQEQEAGENTS